MSRQFKRGSAGRRLSGDGGRGRARGLARGPARAPVRGPGLVGAPERGPTRGPAKGPTPRPGPDPGPAAGPATLRTLPRDSISRAVLRLQGAKPNRAQLHRDTYCKETGSTHAPERPYEIRKKNYEFYDEKQYCDDEYYSIFKI